MLALLANTHIREILAQCPRNRHILLDTSDYYHTTGILSDIEIPRYFTVIVSAKDLIQNVMCALQLLYRFNDSYHASGKHNVLVPIFEYLRTPPALAHLETIFAPACKLNPALPFSRPIVAWMLTRELAFVGSSLLLARILRLYDLACPEDTLMSVIRDPVMHLDADPLWGDIMQGTTYHELLPYMDKLNEVRKIWAEAGWC